MEVKKIQTASVDVARINVKMLERVDGDPKETEKSFDLVLDFAAVALALEKTGIDFAKAESWFPVPMAPKNLITLLWCAFQRFHSEVNEEEVAHMIAPAEQWSLHVMLMDLAFPGWTDRIVKANKEAEAQDKDGPPAGESQPAAVAKS
jgi:hypothetical protein